MEAVEILLIQIGVILLLSRILGAAMRYIHQPQVIGEMVAGIMLGPSLLGLIRHGDWMNALFPAGLLGNLNVLSQLGVILFMFLVGLDLEPRLMRSQGKTALVTGSVGIALPLLCGVALAMFLIRAYPAVTGPVPSRLVLCLFMGAAMSITAFPVLARILTERNLHKTKSGALALTCAAMNDVLGWCILAFVLAVAHMHGFGKAGADKSNALVSAMNTALLAAVFVALMIWVVRPLLGRLSAYYDVRGYLSQNVLAAVFLLLIGSSLSTGVIGIHPIFGAFMLGAVMPKNGRFVRHLSEKMEDFTVLFLLPLFFAYTGLRTDLGSLHTAGSWGICGLIVLTAIAGKFGGVSLAARFTGMSWRQSGLLGVLMNTRGLMELIILNIGFTFGVLSGELFSMMVVMAMVTTFMTTPLMALLYTPARQKEELEDVAREDAEKIPGSNVVVPVSNKATAPSLVRMGAMLMGGEPGRIYALHLDRPDEVEQRTKGVVAEAEEVLDVAQSVADTARVPISAVSFVSRNIGRDIADSARRYHASWVVMGWPKLVFFNTALGATLSQVVRQAPANVAILVDKGLDVVSRVIVPYLGELQDRGALIAAERLGRLPGVKVTILHVVKPNRSESEARLKLEAEIDQQFPPAGGHGSVRMQVVESDSPIDVVVDASRGYDLMILGLTGEWNLQNKSLFGKHETIAERSRCSLLIVHANPQAPVFRAPRATEPALDVTPDRPHAPV